MISPEKLYILKKHVSSALNKKLPMTECAELINISKKVVIPYLTTTKSSFLKLSRIHGLDINDLAIDVIAEVFRQDAEGNMLNLVNFASKLWTDISTITDENFFRAYQSYLRTIADVHIARSYAELDPNGFKIQRNIKETLPTDTLELRKNILGIMIFVKGSEEYDSLPYLCYEEFEKDFLVQASGKITTREILDVIQILLVCDYNARKEISLSDAVRLFKKHFKVDQLLDHEEEPFEQLFNDSFVDKYEIDQICGKVLDTMRGKIFIDYFSKGKLTLEQTKALDNAVKDIVFDLVNLGRNHISFYEYLTKYIMIEREDYELKFKSKLEYLIKQARESFRNYLYTRE